TKPTSWPNKRTYLGVGIDDTASGLTHIGAREYDQDSGRFLSADPLIDITDPLQMNGYAYSRNSPISQSDPTGLKPMFDSSGGNSGTTSESVIELDTRVAYDTTVILYTSGKKPVRNSSNTSEAEYNKAAHLYDKPSGDLQV
uniref:RHS repeat-associated core domain-containing protein n=1 Tax=Streptomyces sp. NK08204 TaxID=2873260 RepID=UPI001CEC6394